MREVTDFIFLDLEMAQPSNKIIQVGYVIANLETSTLRCMRSIFVNPNETLSPEIIKLTGITQEQVDTGVTLQQAYEQIKADLQEQASFGNECFINPVTWGGGDSELLRKQLGMEDERFIFGRRWIDAKTLYVSWAIANGFKPMGGLGNSLKKLKMKFQGRKHNALDDALNTFYIFQKLTSFLKLPSKS